MPDNASTFDSLRIFFTGVGGQGTLLATRLVGEAALEEGLPVGMSEIHGMAQRGGVVESSVVMGDVLSPTIADGEADILMAFEPLEAARALPKCHADTVVISSTVPIVPFTVATGQSSYPEIAELFQRVERHVARLVKVDAVDLARRTDAERAANIALVGVLAGMKSLPISEKSWQGALKRTIPPRFLEMNMRAFDAGWTFGSRL